MPYNKQLLLLEQCCDIDMYNPDPDLTLICFINVSNWSNFSLTTVMTCKRWLACPCSIWSLILNPELRRRMHQQMAKQAAKSLKFIARPRLVETWQPSASFAAAFSAAKPIGDLYKCNHRCKADLWNIQPAARQNMNSAATGSWQVIIFLAWLWCALS